MGKKTKSNVALEAMLNRISSGLNRLSVTTPSKWAENYRMMPGGLWNFNRHPWLRDMHDSTAEKNVGQKAAQMGYTETLLNLAFFTIDVLARDVLYVLPNKTPNASDFSSGRFDPALELSPHLKTLFSDVHNIGHKRAGSANLYVRGSQSRADLKSLPINTLLMDEVAEFVEENIPLALERVSGQEIAKRIIWMISTPTVEGFGISKYYNYSDKKEFFFKCPSCNRIVNLKFPESLVICGTNHLDPDIRKSYLICFECKVTLPQETKSDWLSTGRWVPQVSGREWSGFSISQLYSTTIRPSDIVESYFKAQINPADEVELYNSKLGQSHEIKGARVADADLDLCMYKGKKNRSTDPIPTGLITMGIDVGKYLHYEITYWIPKEYAGDVNLSWFPIVLVADKCTSFSDLDRLMREYRVYHAVIDANPERRMAMEFCLRNPSRATTCMFGRGIRGKTIQKPKTVEYDEEPTVLVDRSSWLDLSLGRFKNTAISLPIDTSLEYREHIKAPVKHYTKDENGNPVAKYLTQGSLDDHFAFARLYSEVALKLASANMGNQNIEEI